MAQEPLKKPSRPECFAESTLTEKQKQQARKERFAPENERSRSPALDILAAHRKYGFVSRGEESRLQKSVQAQREYFDWILETFRQVEKAGLALSPSSTEAFRGGAWSQQSSANSEQVLTSLRKLREALLHQKPCEFSKKVYLFSVRVSSAVGHYQTYVPSIQYLLGDARMLLSATERSEVASILVLHVSHRNERNSEALGLFFTHLDAEKDARTLATVLAWAQGDYHAWMSLYNSESDHLVFAVMSMGLPRMMQHMVACFGDSFFTYKMTDFKECLPKGVTWEAFKEKYGVTWELEDDTVHIRRRQQKKGPIRKKNPVTPASSSNGSALYLEGSIDLELAR